MYLQPTFHSNHLHYPQKRRFQTQALNWLQQKLVYSSSMLRYNTTYRKGRRSMLSPSPSGPQPSINQALPQFIPSPGSPILTDGTGVGNIYVTNTSSHPALRTRSMVVKRRPGPPTSITYVRHDTCKIKTK